MTADEASDLKSELSTARRTIAKLKSDLCEWEIIGSQHKAQLNERAGRWFPRYVLVVEYDFCKRHWRYFAHQMHLSRPIVKEGTALTFENAKAEAEDILKRWCAERKSVPDVSRLSEWRALSRMGSF
ncbi:MAG: hypothetical protein WBX38_18150 [Candidatus Sulfotelmatobacter sp.]